MRKPVLLVALCTAVASLSLAAFAADLPKVDLKGVDKVANVAKDTGNKVATVAAAAAKPAIGQPAPQFTATDAKGNKVSLADLKGKIVVLEWVNIDCPIDVRVVKEERISKVHAKFKDKSVWLAIDSTAAHKQADYDRTIKDWKLEYPLLNDASGTIGHMYAATNTPHMYIIDAEGKLAYMGGIDNEKPVSEATNYVHNALEELLAGKPVTISESKAYGCSVKYAK